MTPEDVISFGISIAVHVGVVALLTGIVVANLYAILHAWRSDRTGWFVLLIVLFVNGGGIATAIYLIMHIDEPLPARSSPRVAA